MEDTGPYRPSRRGLAGSFAALALAFLLGLALAAWGVHRSDRIARWLHPIPAPVAMAAPAPVRAPAVASLGAADPALAERVGAIEGRIDAIAARASAARGDADRAEGLLVAFAARRALDRGQPLGFLEGMLRERFGGTQAPAVAMVIAASQRPVTLGQLQDGLAQRAPALAGAGSGEGWWRAARAEFAGLLVVRRADVPSPAPVDRLTRATRALEQGQVDTAAAEVARLPSAPKAGDWLASAHRYILARSALDRLETAALLAPRAPAAGED